MTTLTKHPAKAVKPFGADRIGDVHYWNGKPLPPIFYEDPENRWRTVCSKTRPSSE